MTKVKRAKQNKPRKQAKQRMASIKRGLDIGAQRWMALLSDPCNAPLTSACYPGVGSGMLYRTRTVIGVGGSATDSYCYFVPSANFGVYYPLQWASVNTTDTFPTNLYGASVNGLPSGAQVRCIAACLKARYTGSELSRAGMVGHIYTMDPPYVRGNPSGVAGTYYQANSLLSSAQTTYRLGETQHEVRWFPSFEDGNFVALDPVAGASDATYGAAVGLVVRGAPAGSVYYELTAVYEVNPDAGSGILPPLQPPASRNTLNEVLTAIGNVGRWATEPANMRRVYNAVSTVSSAARALTTYAAPLAMVAM